MPIKLDKHNQTLKKDTPFHASGCLVTSWMGTKTHLLSNCHLIWGTIFFLIGNKSCIHTKRERCIPKYIDHIQWAQSGKAKKERQKITLSLSFSQIPINLQNQSKALSIPLYTYQPKLTNYIRTTISLTLRLLISKRSSNSLLPQCSKNA